MTYANKYSRSDRTIIHIDLPDSLPEDPIEEQDDRNLVPLTEEVEEYCDRLIELRNQIQHLKEEEKLIRDFLVAYIGDANGIEDTQVHIKRSKVAKLGVSAKEIFESNPELFKELDGHFIDRSYLYARVAMPKSFSKEEFF